VEATAAVAAIAVAAVINVTELARETS